MVQTTLELTFAVMEQVAGYGPDQAYAIHTENQVLDEVSCCNHVVGNPGPMNFRPMNQKTQAYSSHPDGGEP